MNKMISILKSEKCKKHGWAGGIANARVRSWSIIAAAVSKWALIAVFGCSVVVEGAHVIL